jgi:hypothetical protein
MSSMRTALVLIVTSVCILSVTSVSAALPYIDEEPPPQDRRYHFGVLFSGVRHLGGQGMGLYLSHSRPYSEKSPVKWGFEGLFLSSGERRIPRSEAHNPHFLADSLYGGYSNIYETASSIGFGGSFSYTLRKPADRFSIGIPGVALALSGGVMLETDRVGLSSSEYDQYYGSISDTNFTFRPYLRPSVVFTQGAISLMMGMSFLPVFTSWNFGIAYGW